MRIQIIHAVLLLSTLLGPVSAIGQETPADTARVILGVAEKLRAKGEDEDAERLLMLVRRLYPSSDAAVLAGNMLAELRRSSEDGSGATELIVFNTFYGAALGVIIPAALGAEDPEPYGAGILLGAPAGYGVVQTLHEKVSRNDRSGQGDDVRHVVGSASGVQGAKCMVQGAGLRENSHPAPGLHDPKFGV